MTGRGRPPGALHPERDVHDEFPEAVRRSLAASKAAGRPFDAAWLIALGITPSDPDWLLDDGELEPPLAFLRRHMEAAYHGEVAARHCQAPECDRLAHTGSRCAQHLLADFETRAIAGAGF